MRVVFMGTPEFACPSLTALVEAGHEVAAVVTRPDKPAGRGRKLAPPPVKEVAAGLGLTVLQPLRVNDEASVGALRALAPDAVVVTAFGAILKRPLLTLGRLGAVNLHASLLPAYRGVAPVQWSLIHGRRTTGVTTMLMDDGVDTGPILERRVLEVRPLETAGELLVRLSEAGGGLLVETLRGLDEGTLRPLPQPEEGASYAPRLEREHGHLDFSRTAEEVLNQFRGTTPAPGARVFLGGEAIGVGAARAVPEASGTPYAVLEVAHRHLRVAAGRGAVDLLLVRPPGKGDMEGAAFARGRNLSPGDRLTAPSGVPDLSLRTAVTR
jgi:methionyl-tRNA formyltransferase